MSIYWHLKCFKTIEQREIITKLFLSYLLEWSYHEEKVACGRVVIERLLSTLIYFSPLESKWGNMVYQDNWSSISSLDVYGKKSWKRQKKELLV